MHFILNKLLKFYNISKSPNHHQYTVTNIISTSTLFKHNITRCITHTDLRIHITTFYKQRLKCLSATLTAVQILHITETETVSVIYTVILSCVHCVSKKFTLIILRLLSQMLIIFTALHAMQTRSSDENSVCLSVRHTRAL